MVAKVVTRFDRASHRQNEVADSYPCLLWVADPDRQCPRLPVRLPMRPAGHVGDEHDPETGLPDPLDYKAAIMPATPHHAVTRLRRTLPAIVVLTLAGCGGGGDSTPAPAPAPASIERQINATTTDTSITAAPAGAEAPHVAITPSPAVSARGKLLVFLPGTQGRPTQYLYILRASARCGFHAVGLNP